MACKLFQKRHPASADNCVDLCLLQCFHDVQQLKENSSFARSGEIFCDLDCVCHLFTEAQCMLDQKFCLLFASTTIRGEVHVELDWVHAREPVNKRSGTVEDATCVIIVGFRGHHQNHICSFSDRL